MPCAVCANTSFSTHLVREMMLGTREQFAYNECSGCGCISIAEAPESMQRFYPAAYGNFLPRFSPSKSLYYRAHFLLPGLMRKIRRCSADLESVIRARPRRGAKILDVGCGGGRLVSILRNLGYDAHGVDPYTSAENLFVRKVHLAEMTGKWDFIMFHHSLEHMMDHAAVLTIAKNLLAPGGQILVRIPIANAAWRKFRTDWAQLDAPRHFVIHSPNSFPLVASAAGLTIDDTYYDSNEFQFYASELYRNDIPLHDPRANGFFTPSQLRDFQNQADALNARGEGDQAVFLLTGQNA